MNNVCSLLVCGVYIPPSEQLTKYSTFCDEFERLTVETRTESGNICLLSHLSLSVSYAGFEYPDKTGNGLIACIETSKKKLKEKLEGLNVSKCCGPDGIPALVLH
ncbi:hypothetical protein J6590_031979 [Homalodisca vitripennis]|nr:hypothetical protein J6590_031979 [Homalodisca vitripennis]